jgi:hypothetical protein
MFITLWSEASVPGKDKTCIAQRKDRPLSAAIIPRIDGMDRRLECLMRLQFIQEVDVGIELLGGVG